MIVAFGTQHRGAGLLVQRRATFVQKEQRTGTQDGLGQKNALALCAARASLKWRNKSGGF
jgi:hypothetical protein